MTHFLKIDFVIRVWEAILFALFVLTAGYQHLTVTVNAYLYVSGVQIVYMSVLKFVRTIRGTQLLSGRVPVVTTEVINCSNPLGNNLKEAWSDHFQYM